ncbi:MAG: Fic family protein [Planctomycetia bacterium]|nr:Fic family protein [Planctomycetia bacterium]
MNTSHFASNSPGTLHAIQWDGIADRAFVPNPLPPDFKLTDEIWPLIVEARSNLSLLEGVGRRVANPAMLLNPLATREALQSSRIEGTYATPRQVFLFEKIHDTSAEGRASSSAEVLNYRRALKQGDEHPLPLSLRLIRDLHRTLMTGVRGGDQTPGEFRKVQVAIGESRRFVPPPPIELARCLDDFEKYLHVDNNRFDPLVDCFLAHYQFETIHPFKDGNGRVGRLLLALMTKSRCEMTKPWLYLSDYFERYRREYVDNLYRVSSTGDWASWIAFCLRATIYQAKDTILRCDRLMQLHEEYLDRIGKLGKRARLVELAKRLFTGPFIGISELSIEWKVYYQVAQRHLEELEKIGIVKELPGFQPRTFYSPEVYRIAYEDLGSVNE